MKFFINLSAFIAAAFVFCGSCLAQDAAFMPTSGWLVGPASLNQAEGGERLPCLAVNQFANGLTMRLSGGGGKLIAMAVDFHQNFFKPHQKYDADFSMAGKFSKTLNGSAYDDQTLVFSLYKMQDFYKSLETADILTIKGGGTTISLNMAGLADGLQRMEACYGAKPVKTAQKADSKKISRQNPLIAEASGLTPMPGENESPPVPPGEDDNAAPAPVPSRHTARPAQPDEPEDSATALLARAKDADQAAQDLSRRSPAREKPAGRQMASSWTKPQIRRTQTDVLSPPVAAAPVKEIAEDLRWRAPQGSDLHDVLIAWSQSAGVKLVWLARQDFTIDRTISLSGDFPFAVQSLLDQYAAQQSRPTGRIYRQKGSNSLVLVVQQQTGKRK